MAIVKLKPQILLNLSISILTGVFAQLSMKYGMSRLKNTAGRGGQNLSAIRHSVKYSEYALFIKILKILIIIFTNKFVIAGITLYIISMFFWIKVLSKIELSAAYPFVSIGIILTVILAALTLKETVPLMRWIGIIITLCGVYVIVYSHEDDETSKNKEK